MTNKNFGRVDTVKSFQAFADRLMASNAKVGFDIEAGYLGDDKVGVSLLQHHPDWILVGFSFTNGPDWARYVPIAHDLGGNIDDIKEAARILWRILNTCDIRAHNAVYELTGVSRWMMELLGDDPELGAEIRAAEGRFPLICTMIQAKVLAEYDPLRVGAGLKGLSKHVLNQEMTEFKSLFPEEDTDMGPGTKKARLKYIRFNSRNSASPAIINYACEDATAAWELDEVHAPMIEASEMAFIFKVEMKLLPILVDAEFEGLVLDWGAIHQALIEVVRFRDLMNEEIQIDFAARTGNAKPVLLSSPKQLAEVLFAPKSEGGFGLPIKKRSEKTEAPSTGDDALRVIAQKDPIIKSILTWRTVDKLRGSYLNKYDTELNYAGNGRAYPNHNQIGAGTGRMSVDGVSYQQWPKPYEYILKSGEIFRLNFRDFLIAPENHRIIGFDYSQVELRVLAGQAQEDAMLEAFANGIDIHKATASNMLRIALEDVTKKDRAVGKTSNFAVVYQSGAENIADMLTAQGSPTTTAEAEEMLKAYYKAFPKLRAWMDKQIADGSSQHYVHTFMGRKFTIWEYKDSRPFIRSKGDRLCVNAPIQGGAADYAKVGVIRAVAAIKKAEAEGVIPPKSIKLVMSIHDALEFYVHNDVATQTVVDILDPAVAYDSAKLGNVQIKADWHEAKSWGHPIELKRNSEGTITSYSFDDAPDEYADMASFDEALQAFYDYEKKSFAEKDQKLREKMSEALGVEVPAPVPVARSEKVSVVTEEESPDYVGGPHPDTGFADDYHTFYPHEEGVEEGPDYCRACDAHKDSPLHNVIKTPPTPQGPLQPGPSENPPDDPTPWQEPKDVLTEQDQRDEKALVGDYFRRYHREAKPGEPPIEWLKRIGVDPKDAIDYDIPVWAHARGLPRGFPVREAYEFSISEMPEESAFDIFNKALDKMRGGNTAVRLVTPDGPLEIGKDFAIRTEYLDRMANIIHAQWKLVSETVAA